MVEKGSEIPSELLQPPKRGPTDFRIGLVLLLGGFGVLASLAAIAPVDGGWTVGLIPILMGIGYLIAARVSTPRSDDGPQT
jgi:hypothetical protein